MTHPTNRMTTPGAAQGPRSLTTARAGVAGLLLSLVACGGSGSSSGNPTPAPTLPPTAFQITGLVSDQASAGAATTDANLVNAWGLAYGPRTDFWVANQGSATSPVYDGLGNKPAVPVVVSVPMLPAHVMASPTGMVFNGAAAFAGDEFIVASLEGCICGWSAGTTMTRRVDNSPSAAIYTGLAQGAVGTTTYLFAANLASGTVDVFDATYAPISLGTAAFVDPTLPAGFSPYNVQVLAGNLYVTYAQHAPAALRETPGAGLGYVSVFSLDGTFVRRIASGGALNAPWGLAIAPAGFGAFGGALLVGNFGDGHITAFDATTGAQLGQLSDANNAPLAIPGLWALSFGNDASAGSSRQLYVTAGPQAESHGLFATISYGAPYTGGGVTVGSGY